MVFVVGLIAAYLFGSIPTAYIFGKMLKGIDIRQHGSGNIGATNVFRVMGKGAGITVLLLDIFKGFWVVAIVAEVLGLVEIWQLIFMSIATVLGHNYTIFLKFKGGKGVATSLGVLLGLMVKIASLRIVVLVTLLAFVICFLLTRIVSVSSLFAAVVLPVMMAVMAQPFELVLLGVVFSVFVVYRHRPNIQRLLAGQEPKVPFPWARSK